MVRGQDYYWAKTDAVPGNDIVNERIMAAVDRGMAQRGWTKAPEGQADLAVAANRKLVWRGVATDTVSDNPQKNAEHIDKAVEKMFGKKFMEGDETITLSLLA